MAFTHADIPDQSHRIAVVTGANGGLGLEVVEALAARGAHVVMAVRDTDRGAVARERVRSRVPGASLEVQPLDLASRRSVAAAGHAIADAHPRLDLLINNAGVMAVPQTATADGLELQLAVNHLGHFALTAHLLPALLQAPAARVVSVTSTGRHVGRPVHEDDPYPSGRYGPWRAYGRSKLANVHFAVELHRRLAAAGAGLASLVAHPGLALTGLQHGSVEASDGGASQRFFRGLARTTGMPTAHAALPLLRAATDPRARSGELYAPRFVNAGPPVRRPLIGRSVDPRHTARLWTVSERATGVTCDVASLFAGEGA